MFLKPKCYITSNCWLVLLWAWMSIEFRLNTAQWNQTLYKIVFETDATSWQAQFQCEHWSRKDWRRWLRFDLILLTKWKFKLLAGKFPKVNKEIHCWVSSTNFWEQKLCWHHPAMFCLYTFPAQNLNFHWRWWDRI